MKLFQKIVLLGLFSSYLFGAEHCIQVTGVNRFNPEHIKPEYIEIFENFDKARIDKRGRRLVLRVGAYPNASSAKRDLRRLKRYYRDAFIRRCDYDPATAVYPVFEDKVEPVKQTKKVKEKPVEFVEDVQDEMVMDIPQEDVVEIVEEPVAEMASEPVTLKQPAKPFKYTKQKKYNYEFWQECQKCFAPITNEASGNYEEVEEPEEDSMQEVLEDDEMATEDEMQDAEPIIVKSSKKPLKRRDEEKTEKESKGWFSSLFSSSDDDEEEEEDADIEIDDEESYENESTTSNNDNIFSDDQNDIEEPVAQNTDVVEDSGSYYDNN